MRFNATVHIIVGAAKQTIDSIVCSVSYHDLILCCTWHESVGSVKHAERLVGLLRAFQLRS